MSCVQCAKSFSRLSPELSCAGCHLSFCKKCLSHSVTFPGKEGKPAKVCYTCFDRIVNHKPLQDTSDWEPPANFVKRMEALEKRNAAPITSRPQTNTRRAQVDSLAARADALLDAGKGPLPSDDELQARLNALKEFSSHRLSRQSPLPKLPDTEEEQVNNLVSRFIDEARIAKTYNSQVDPEKPEADVVFCCLCEEDASVICHDCDDDEFCKQCFKKSHKSLLLKKHRTSPIPIAK